MKNCTLLRREAHVEVKKYKAHQNTPFSDHFSKLRCRKSARRCGAKRILEVKMHKAHQVHGALLEVVARSTFQSQNVQNTPGSEHFWKLRCRNSARRCGGKHISKSKCTKHTRFGALLEVEMSKKCMPLWPNSSDEHVSCTAPAMENASLQILFKFPTPAIVLEMPQNPHVLLTYDKVHNPLRLPSETTSERQKHFDFEMCFAPGPGADFLRHFGASDLQVC